MMLTLESFGKDDFVGTSTFWATVGELRHSSQGRSNTLFREVQIRLDFSGSYILIFAFNFHVSARKSVFQQDFHFPARSLEDFHFSARSLENFHFRAEFYKGLWVHQGTTRVHQCYATGASTNSTQFEIENTMKSLSQLQQLFETYNLRNGKIIWQLMKKIIKII